MADFTQIKGPTNAASLGVGIAWVNPTNIYTQNVSTSDSDLQSNDVTQYLRGYNYNFTLEQDATVLGISLRIRGFAESQADISDSQLYMTDTSGNNKGTNRATGINWPTVDSDITYGGPTDLWGALWSADDINNVNFGVQLAMVNNTSGNKARMISVDYMEITVYYERPDGQAMLLQVGAF